MEVIGTGGKAFHHKVQQPRQIDAYDPTEPTQREALTQQAFIHSARRIQNEMVFGRGPKLVLAGFALMILLAVAGMAIFLVAL
jgi:hypothetical protein